MALWRVLDLYKRDALRRGQAHVQTTRLNSAKRSTPSRADVGESEGIRPSVPFGGKCSATERYVISFSCGCRCVACPVV